MVNPIRWTAEQVAQLERGRLPPKEAPAPPPKPSKYRNTRVKQDGITFDSAKEARRWAWLQQLEKAGLIKGLRRQVPYVLAPAIHIVGEERKKPALRYIADATYVQDGHLIVEDTKSEVTRKADAYRIKKHLMATVHGIHVREV